MKFLSWFKRKKHHPSSSSASMDIREFVKASIIGVMCGIRDAQNEFSQGNSAYDPLISPAWGPPLSDAGGSAKGHADKMHELEFDLAITVRESTSAKANGAAQVQVVGVYSGELGCETEAEGGQSTVSRIRFKIPVRYPLAKLSKPDWNPKETSKEVSTI